MRRMPSDLPHTQPVEHRAACVSRGADPSVCARLVPLTEGGSHCELRREQREAVVGRHPDCHLVVTDKRVSAKHLRIYWGEGGFFVQELSQNACFVNEHRLEKSDVRELRHNDTLSLCVQADQPGAEDEQKRTFAAWVFMISDHDVGGQPPPAAARSNPGRRVMSEQWVQERWDTRTAIGCGHFSEVRLGVRVKDGEKFAVKVIDVSKFLTFQNKRDSRLALTSEAEVLTTLQHPGIVRCHEWFETGEKLYLVMELLLGGDLLQCILDHGCFSEARGRELFHQIVEAVEFLHGRNVVHRDLKPENVLLTAKDPDTTRIKLGDFGLARTTNRTQDCKTFCGTPQYIAPEVIKTFRDREAGADSGYDRQADMWSLGVILYIMLSGMPPFDDEGLYEQILEANFEFDCSEWNVVSPEARGLVRQLMTVDPKRRLTIQEASSHITSRWLLPPAAGVPRDSPAEGNAPAAKRRRSECADGRESPVSLGAAAAALGA